MSFSTVEDECCVGICCEGRESTTESFVDIYVDDNITPSPFKSKREAKMFAEIIIKLLESVMK